MDIKEIEKFRANYDWFNQFFSDLRQLLEAISNILVSESGLKTSSKSWYYEKPNYQPTLPAYYVTALSSKTSVVQIYAVLNTNLFNGQPAFKKEPSLVIVKHSRTDRVLYTNDYGLMIIGKKQISQTQMNEKVIGGEIRGGEGKGTQYFAFQVLFDSFLAGKDINSAIQTEIVDVLKELTDWEGK
jgi:hypothetical protein